MKLLIAILLLSSVLALPLDGVCDRDQGESCMNNPDCASCKITSQANATYFGTYAVVSINVTNHEPAEVPLIVNVRNGNKILKSKQVDIRALKSAIVEWKLDRSPKNQSLIVEIRDRDIKTVWNYRPLILLGLENKGKPEFLIPILAVFSFLGILFLGFRQIRNQKSPYIPPMPVYMPAYQPPKEEIIVVPKKKKYYYKKN